MIKKVFILSAISFMLLSFCFKRNENFKTFNQLVSNNDCYKIKVLSDILKTKPNLYFDTLALNEKVFNSTIKTGIFKKDDIINNIGLSCTNEKRVRKLKYHLLDKNKTHDGDYVIKFFSKIKVNDNYFQMITIKKIDSQSAMKYGYTIIVRFKENHQIDYALAQTYLID